MAEEAAQAETDTFRDEESARLAEERRRLEADIRAEIASRDAQEGPARPVRRVVVVRPTPRPAPGTEPAAPRVPEVEGASRAAAPEAVTETATPAETLRAVVAAYAAEGFADEDSEAPVVAPPVAAGSQTPPAQALDDSDDEEPLTDATLQARVAQALGATGLAAEEEAELVAELAAVEREAESARRAEAQRRALLRSEADDAAVDRLISHADTELSGPEAQRRQSTLSHLKAAVIATRAEEEAGEARRPEDEEQAEIARYRQDLERSVRRPAGETTDEGQPRRPATRPQAQRTERPRSAQPPLVLVSEQRIDRPAETELVRPRRINAGALAMEELFDEDAPAPVAPRGKAFGDFVGPMHLTTLAELTEAAAAYVTHVEGLEEFTRPQVMRHVVSTGQPMTRSRENLLRTFGTLMRQGTMQRSRRGQFELAQGSEFAERARRFAQG